MQLQQFVKAYQPFNEEEKTSQQSFIQFLDAFDPSLWAVRENLVGHLTSSAWVVNPQRTKVLFAFHNLYNSWAWLGGHADGDLDLRRVACKEAQEESGILKVRPVLEEPFDLSVLHVLSHVKKGRVVLNHLHFNVTYLLEAEETEALRHKPDENAGVAWLETHTLMDHVSEEFMKPIYRRLIDKVQQL